MTHTGQTVTLKVAKQGAFYHGLATQLSQPSPVMQRGKLSILSIPYFCILLFFVMDECCSLIDQLSSSKNVFNQSKLKHSLKTKNQLKIKM